MPLDSFPVEILAEILGIVLKDAIIGSTEQQCPVLSLQQYRALILTCKLFKTIVDTTCVKLMMLCSRLNQPNMFWGTGNARVLVSLCGVMEPIHDTRHCKTPLLRKWVEVFKLFQVISVRHMCLSDTTLGKFWCNQYIKLDDFPTLSPDILKRLRPLFERQKRPPIEVERKINRQYQLYAIGDVVNVLTGRNKSRVAISVRTWKALNMPLSSLSLSARVKEWWIVAVKTEYSGPREYFVGYYDRKALVVEVGNWKLHQTVVQKKPAWR